MFWRGSLICIVSFVTTSLAKLNTKRGEQGPHEESLKFQDASLELAKLSIESLLIDKDIPTKSIDVLENKAELPSLDHLYGVYEEDGADDSSGDAKRVKRQNHGYPLSATMPSYFSRRQGKQLTVTKQEPLFGHFYLPDDMPSYVSNRQAKQIEVNPDQVFTSDEAYMNYPLDHSVQHIGEKAEVPLTNYHDYGAKIAEDRPWNSQYQDYIAKSNANVPSVSQDYIDYYDTVDYGDQLSDDYYDYLAYRDFLADYPDVEELGKVFMADEPTKDKMDTNSQIIKNSKNSETKNGNSQVDSPLVESNIDEIHAVENGYIPFFEHDYIESTGDEKNRKQPDEKENDKMEKDDENKSGLEYTESSEDYENDEDILTNYDKTEEKSAEESLTKKGGGGAQVYSIDPEGRISTTGLGEKDVKRLIHQITDIKEGRNLAFMQKFEGLIHKMLN